MWTPLPWRKSTPLHHQLGVRSNRFVYNSAAVLPSLTAPQTINLRYDGATQGIDRIIGFTLSIQGGQSTGCDFVVQELNTGWFLDYTYPGTNGAYLQANIETLVDECDLSFYFTVDLATNIYVSFQNVEVGPARVTGTG